MGELFLETKSVPTSTSIGAMRFSIVVLEQVPAIFGLIERNGWKYLILVKSDSSFFSEDDFCKVPWSLVYVIVPDVQDGIFVSQFMSVIFRDGVVVVTIGQSLYRSNRSPFLGIKPNRPFFVVL